MSEHSNDVVFHGRLLFPTTRIMAILFTYLKRYKKILFWALFLGSINQIFSLLDPQIFRLIVDRYASRAGEWQTSGFIRGVLTLLAASIGVAFVSRVAKSFQDYYVNVVTQRVGTELYAHGVAHALSLPYAVFEDQRSGEILLKLQKARQDVQTLIASAINTIFLSLVGILFVLVYAATVHWAVALAYSLVIPLLGASTFIIGRRIKLVQRRIVARSAELAGSTTETLRNVELVKSLGLEAQETRRLNAVNDQVLDLELTKVKLVRALSFIQGTLVNALRSAILFLMLWLIFSKSITLGQFFSLFIYSFFVFTPLGELGTVAGQYQEAKGSMEAYRSILDTPPEERAEHPATLHGLTAVEFRNVGFEYGELTVPAVRDASFSIRRGETAAFVGPSGSGKSTIVKLMVGLYRPQRGRIYINGADAATVDNEAFRSRIGYVSQETQLFAGTIRENLLFVRPDASDEECIAALTGAAALSVIERSGDGLATKIGEGGIKISGGERQRIAIARALLRKPELVIFDEATSSLDSITERSVSETIRGVTATRPDLMVVLIAHRLSTIAHADTIYVLERGGIVEKGSHETLIALKGLYAALWREQAVP